MFKHFVSTVQYQLIGIFVSLLSSVATARLLGTAARGEITSVTASLSILSLLLGMGQNSAITHYVARGDLAISSAFTNIYKISGLSFVCATVITAVCSLLDISGYIFGTDSYLTMAIVPFAVAIAVAGECYAGILSARKEFILINQLRFLSSFVLVVFCLGLLCIYRQGTLPSSVILVLQLAISLTICVTYIYFCSQQIETETATKNDASTISIRAYGIKSVLSDFLQFLSYRLDVWIVLYFLGSDQFGIYSLGVALAQYLWLVPSALSGIVFSDAATSIGSDSTNLQRLSRIVLVTVFLLAIVLIPTLLLLVPFMYGDAFSDSAIIFAILCAGVVPFSVCKVLASAIAGSGRVHVNVAASLLGAIATVGFDFMLIPKLGVIGASIATVVSYLITSLFVVVAASKIMRCPISELLVPTSADLKLMREKLCKSTMKK